MSKNKEFETFAKELDIMFNTANKGKMPVILHSDRDVLMLMKTFLPPDQFTATIKQALTNEVDFFVVTKVPKYPDVLCIFKYFAHETDTGWAWFLVGKHSREIGLEMCTASLHETDRESGIIRLANIFEQME